MYNNVHIFEIQILHIDFVHVCVSVHILKYFVHILKFNSYSYSHKIDSYSQNLFIF